MPTLTITKDYKDGEVLTEAALDEIKSSLETFLNTTKLDYNNFQDAGVAVSDIATATIALTNLNADITDRMIPIGTILSWYSFSAVLTFSTAVYAYCNGATAVTVTGLGPVAMPDLSNRYLVGFGTEGAGDQNTATWSAAAVGNVTSTTSLVSHTHDQGTLQFRVMYAYCNGPSAIAYRGSTDGTAGGLATAFTSFDSDLRSNVLTMETMGDFPMNVAASTKTYYTNDGTGDSTAGTSGSFDWQPRSLRVRYIMRIA